MRPSLSLLLIVSAGVSRADVAPPSLSDTLKEYQKCIRTVYCEVMEPTRKTGAYNETFYGKPATLFSRIGSACSAKYKVALQAQLTPYATASIVNYTIGRAKILANCSIKQDSCSERFADILASIRGVRTCEYGKIADKNNNCVRACPSGSVYSLTPKVFSFSQTILSVEEVRNLHRETVALERQRKAESEPFSLNSDGGEMWGYVTFGSDVNSSFPPIGMPEGLMMKPLPCVSCADLYGPEHRFTQDDIFGCYDGPGKEACTAMFEMREWTNPITHQKEKICLGKCGPGFRVDPETGQCGPKWDLYCEYCENKLKKLSEWKIERSLFVAKENDGLYIGNCTAEEIYRKMRDHRRKIIRRIEKATHQCKRTLKLLKNDAVWLNEKSELEKQLLFTGFNCTPFQALDLLCYGKENREDERASQWVNMSVVNASGMPF